MGCWCLFWLLPAVVVFVLLGFGLLVGCWVSGLILSAELFWLCVIASVAKVFLVVCKFGCSLLPLVVGFGFG